MNNLGMWLGGRFRLSDWARLTFTVAGLQRGCLLSVWVWVVWERSLRIAVLCFSSAVSSPWKLQEAATQELLTN